MHGLATTDFEPPRQQLGRQLASDGHVHMRVGAVGHQRVSLAQHALGHVGVQVQADDDRQVRPNDRAQPGQQLALAVCGLFGHCGAVQVEVDRIEPTGQCRDDILTDCAGDVVEGLAGDEARRDRAGPARWQQGPALAFGRVDEAANGDVDARQRLLHRGTSDEGREGIAAVESSPVSQAGGEGIGFVLVASNQDTGHSGLSSIRGTGQASLASVKRRRRNRGRARRRTARGCTHAVAHRRPGAPARTRPPGPATSPRVGRRLGWPPASRG